MCKLNYFGGNFQILYKKISIILLWLSLQTKKPKRHHDGPTQNFLYEFNLFLVSQR